MLTVLIGTDWKAGRDILLSQLAHDVAQRQGGRVLLVPEMISHDTERRLAQRAGDTCSRYAEVLSFSRLADRAASAAHCAVRECLDQGGRVVAMAAAIRQLQSKLKAYASVQTRPEFLTGLVDAVDEFKRCCIRAEDLRRASGRTEGAFAQKLEELSLILEAYDAVTAQGKRDPRDQMNWVLEQLESTDYAQTHVFYIDGFPDFTRQHMAIMEHLILESPQITVSINCDRPASSDPAFEKAGKTAAQLLSFARNNHIPVQLLPVDGSDDALHQVCRRLYQGDASAIVAMPGQLQLYRTESVYDECLCAAQRIRELVGSGCRYRHIGVVCSDMTAYENSIRMVFSRCGIPVYRSGSDDVLQKSVIGALLSAMQAAFGGFERTDVLRYMKSVLSPLELTECDLLENYSILWGIDRSRWTRPWQDHPDGLDGVWNEESRQRLDRLDKARERLMAPLIRLSEGFRCAENLEQQVKALCVFLEDIALAERLSALADYMDSVHDNRSAQILNQLWEILLGALEQLQDMLADTVWEADSFLRLFTLLLSQYDVGTIPTVLDAVSVGPVSAMRCHQVKHLIVLGAQEGLLPGYNGNTGVLTDREREQLRGLDVPLTGGGLEGLQSEFGEIYGVFCSATDSILVTCGPEQPSFLYNRLAQMAGGDKAFSPEPGRTLTDPVDAAAWLAARGGAQEAESLGLKEQYENISGRAAYVIGPMKPQQVKALYGQKLNLSASQVDKQADCRFSYFLRYGLRARELKEASVDPAEFGTYFHAVLERTARRVMELGGFHKVSLEQTQELARSFSQEYIAQRFGALDSGRVAYLFSRNLRELECLIRELWMELSVSAFVPDQFELGFGEGKEMPPVQIPGTAMPAQLGGFVDRVDKWNDGHNNYFRVVDYKSGKKSFDYCDVFNGMGLQMLLYMYALEQEGESVLGGQPIPAGVQYFAARFPYMNQDSLLSEETVIEERGKALGRKGLVLADEAVLDAMEPEGAPRRLTVKRKDGRISGDVADREQFKLLKKYVFGILKKLVDEIASGDVTPNPYTRGESHNACRFCPYGSVCHSAQVPGRRDYQAMKAQRFWEEVDREVKGRG